MFAISIAAVALTALAQLFVIADEATSGARRVSLASILAAQKIEELRTADLAAAQASAAALTTNVAGACDFLDQYGRSLGTGTTPVPGSLFVRRWSVEAFAADPDTFLVQAAVFPISWRSSDNPAASDARALGGAQLVTLIRRRAG